jgi:hypothetical protein
MLVADGKRVSDRFRWKEGDVVVSEPEEPEDEEEEE